ncbi:MAG TPA: ABC transporter permease [Clostridiales bacterium]|jgi:peptide/nickel transport system permease protein|nr:ABC transporter permease [Clostridiales bacterium]
MAKLYTPAMAKIEKKRAKRKGKVRPSTPGREAWKRLRRNRLAIAGMIILIALILVAFFADFIAPYGIDEQMLKERNQTPSSKHLMGTDNYGRDIFSRIIYGTRISLPIGFICVIIAFAFGGTLGAIAAYYGGKVDNVIMRIMDIFQSIPPMLMAIAIAASLGNGVVNLVFAISISTMPARSRIVRAAILTVKRNDYIESARAIGANSSRLLIKYMLPNAIGPILTSFTFSVATAILTVSSLSYIGLGITAPTPEWGSMLSAGKELMRQAPHVLIFPGLMIMITVLALNLFGDGLRDALDPRLK